MIVNWQNVSRHLDVGSPDGDEVYRGYAWVGVTVQKLGIDGAPGTSPSLATWDSHRYESLHHPGDAYAYDIFGQVARMLRSEPDRQAPDPLRGLKPQCIVACGRSQSAMRLASYINFAHQHDRIFDGFLLLVHFGLCPPLSERPFLDIFTSDQAGRLPFQTPLREPEGAKVLALSTECEAVYNFGARQPDSDAYRFWEIAGASHSNPHRDRSLSLIFQRDGISSQNSDTDRDANLVEYQFVKDAALRWLKRWMMTGEAPPRLPPIDMYPGPNGQPAIRRDALGNALGGVRLPDLDAATGQHLGRSAGELLESLSGWSSLYSRRKLQETHGAWTAFQRKWNTCVDQLLQQDLILPREAETLRDDALRRWNSAS